MYQSEAVISGVADPKASVARPKTEPEKEGFRPDIEGLRGVAVALVVLFHAGLLSGATVQLTGGFIGVDLFFVVSGYLITGLLIRERQRTGRISFSRFYARRVRRILPAAAVTLLITIPLAYTLETLIDRSSAMEDAASAALSIANIRFALTTDYFNPVSYSPFLHFWSLGVEEQFYFVWPALMAIVAWKASRIGAGVALAAIVVISLAASIQISNDNPSTAFYMLPTRAWQLAAGGLLAVWTGSLDDLPGSVRAIADQLLAFAGWAALTALLTAAIVINSQTTLYPGTAALVPTVAGVVLIASGSRPTGPGLVLRLPPIRFLGKISYSLYLWHWPVLILGGLWLVGPLGTLSPAEAVGLAILAVPVSTLSWMFVEEPFRRGKIPLPRPSRVVAAGVAVMLIVATIGASFGFGAQFASSGELRPSIATAGTDREATAKGCLGGSAITVPPSSCVYGKVVSAYTVALIGDSQASALFPAVEFAAEKRGWRLVVFLKIVCPFYDIPVYNGFLKREYTECGTWNENVVSVLQADPPDLVLVSMSRGVTALDPQQNHAVNEGNALARMLDRLPSRSRKVIIEDPPHPASDVPTCLSANLNNFHRCDYSREVGFRSQVGVREQTAAAATGSPVIDLAGEICPGTGACPVVIDNMIVWRDGGHLTATFSLSLGPTLDTKLNVALTSPQPSQ